MNNIIQIERFRYVKICGERRLFRDFKNNCPRSSENLKPKEQCAPFSIFVFFSEAAPEKLFSKVAVLKFRKIPWKTPVVDFCFSCRAQTFIFTEIELHSMLSLEF